MRTNYVLIDYESVQVKSLELLQQPQFKIRVFLGPNNTKLPTELAVAIQRFGDRAGYIQLDTPSQNALDFHVAYYLGRLAVEEPDAFFHIISRDKGFDPLIKHLKSKCIFAARSETIEGMPCFSPPKIVPPPSPKLEPVKMAPPKTTKVVKESDVNPSGGSGQLDGSPTSRRRVQEGIGLELNKGATRFSSAVGNIRSRP